MILSTRINLKIGVKILITIRSGAEKDKELLKAQYTHTAPVLGDDGYLIIAEENGKIVGFLWAFKREIPAPVDRSEMFINAIEVFPEELRCQGLATQMLAGIKIIAIKESCYQLRAYCDIRNVPSHRLWVKNGYGISPIKMPDGIIVGSYVSLVL